MPRTRIERNFHQLSEFERGRIVGLREAGLSFREIATRLNRSVNTIVRCCQGWFEEGQTGRRTGTGRPRRTTERQDRRLRIMALRDRFVSSRTLADQWFAEYGRPIGIRTIYRRIRSFGLISYRPYLVLPLTLNHRQNRLQWCQERIHGTLEWDNIVFSDESRFCFGMHDGRARIRRRRGERWDPQFAIQRHVHQTVGRQYDSPAIHPRSPGTSSCALSGNSC
ncbi:uncharacterized protein [Euwallacea similis]|uniref:uncharacterized protein n=1 Tax=Euwallacea similis TaxID=1736056 RepID=UPI00344E4BFA